MNGAVSGSRELRAGTDGGGNHGGSQRLRALDASRDAGLSISTRLVIFHKIFLKGCCDFLDVWRPVINGPFMMSCERLGHITAHSGGGQDGVGGAGCPLYMLSLWGMAGPSPPPTLIVSSVQ